VSKKTPRLTAEEEIELARRIKEHGDEDACTQLVLANLGLVVFVVQKLPAWNLSSSLDRDDLVQEGNIALMRAARTWEPKNRFATYARKLIYSQVMRAIENTGLIIHVPIPVQESIRKIKKAENQLTQELCREPTIYEIAGRTSLPVQVVRDRYTIMQRQPISLDAFNRDQLAEEQENE